MRIGVDARPLAAPTTGIGRYTSEIVSRLVASEHEVYLYSHQPLAADMTGAQQRVGRLQQRLLGSVYAQLCYPRALHRDRIDVFFSPRHHLPLLTTVPTVVTVHDLVWRKAPDSMATLGRSLERVLMPASLRKADAVVAVSSATRADLLEYMPALDAKVQVVPEAAFTPRKAASDARGDYMLCVGTFEPRKNLPMVLRAFARLRAGGVTSHRLVLAGNPGWKQDLDALIAELDLTAQVTLLRSVPQPELERLYEGCDFLVHAARYEGFGLPILEALSFGKPVITSNVSSMPEVAGEAALLVDPTSETEIADAMQRLIRDDAVYEQLAAQARPQASKFSWDDAGAATLRIIESVASRRG